MHTIISRFQAEIYLKFEFLKQNFNKLLKQSRDMFLIHLNFMIRMNNILTCIFWRLVWTSLIFWGISKHLAVVIFTLTNHCWKSLKALRNLCCKICSLFWQPLDACKQRLKPWLEAFKRREKMMKEINVWENKQFLEYVLMSFRNRFND